MTIKIHKTVTRHQGRVFDLVTETITLPNSATFDIDVLHHPGAAAIVALTEKNTLLMLRQYRHAVGGYIWEIPAGTLDDQEEPAACAARELTEETGYSAGLLEKLGEITPVPGYSDERIHLFLARHLAPAKQDLDADELLEVHEIGWDAAFEMIYSGEIQDCKTMCGLFLAAKHRN